METYEIKEQLIKKKAFYLYLLKDQKNISKYWKNSKINVKQIEADLAKKNRAIS